MRRGLVGVLLWFAWAAGSALGADAALRAGAAAVEITPAKFPVIVNGGFEEATADRVHDPLFARALVLDDGATKLAIVVVDSCVLPQDLLDEAKRLAEVATKIPAQRLLISATHTHSAPSVMGALGSRPDADYRAQVVPLIARAIGAAHARLQPARLGWAVVEDYEHTHCRRWIRRPDRLLADPFGELNVRANMHPGHENPDVIGPSGPVDPGLSVLAVQTLAGKPLALLANYSMHYYGAAPVSADYYGHFSREMARLVAAEDDPDFVAMMSQGTSGDQMWMDYGRPAVKADVQAYAAAVAQRAHQAYRQIVWRDRAPLAMSETKLTLNRRAPDEKRLAWAKEIAAQTPEPTPRGMQQVYAQEQILLAAEPRVELKLQAVRIGELGITAIPNEVFALTGLRIKAASPLEATFNVALANGCQGYVPPPEQHRLGGYTTWPARTAGLEVEAEPKIVEALVAMLETLAGKPRRVVQDSPTRYSQALSAQKPAAYWRLEEMTGSDLHPAPGTRHAALLEGPVALHLPGPALAGQGQPVNRACHFAGGRMRAKLAGLGHRYSVSLWFWSGLPHDARLVTGYLFSRGPEGDSAASGDHLGIGGTFTAPGRLIVFNGNDRNQVLSGRSILTPKTWNHVVLVRDGERVTLYLNGNREPEISERLLPSYAPDLAECCFAGRSDNFCNLAGMVDEVAVFDRPLGAAEAAEQFRAAGLAAAPTQIALDAPPPRSPEATLHSIKVPEGFTVELVAAEPLVNDPVAIAWGPDGKLWVAEMGDYPLGLDGRMKPCGRVRFLEDRDGDGRFETSTLFLDQVNFPNGVAPWRKGVLVTAAPEIFYAEDSDGDGKADVRTTLYRGFNPGNPQLRVNGLRWGLDNWLYCANGWSGGVAESVATGKKVDLNGHDLRIRPDTGELEAIEGVTEFGRDTNDWGQWFGSDNSNPLFHFYVEQRYLRRNPHLAAPELKRQVVTPANPKVYPLSRPQKRYHSFEQGGHFTSACSTMFYRDELVFLRGDVLHSLVCEPVHNLIQHNLVTRDGLSYRGEHAEKDHDFLASDDPWFRPVMVRTGPDGALWVVDMYRAMVEHPEYLPPQGRAEMAPLYRLGEDRGRIYRVYRSARPPRPLRRLDGLTTDQLVAVLESPNGYERDLAQQMLVWRQEGRAASSLLSLIAHTQRPEAKLHAAYALEALGQSVTSFSLYRERLLNDPHPAVRRQAVLLAERADPRSSVPFDAATLAEKDPGVRLQLACTLGELPHQHAGRLLAELLLADAGDPYISAAALSSVGARNLDTVLGTVLSAEQHPNRGAALAAVLPLAVAFERDERVSQALAAVAAAQQGRYAAWQWTALAGVADALARRKASLEELLAAGGPAGQKTADAVRAMLHAARDVVADESLDLPQRAAAIRLLLREPGRRAADLELLGTLLVPQSPPELQSAVVEMLARHADDAVPAVLLAGWPGHSPALRARVLTILGSRPKWAAALLAAAEQGQPAAGEFDAAARSQLVSLADAALRERAEKLFRATASDRQTIIQAWQPALQQPGDGARGKLVFQKKCAACHKFRDEGQEVGPNLAALTDRSPSALLIAILDPNRSVEQRYQSYTAATADGRTLSGLYVDSGSSITLVGQEGKREVIPRSELAELRNTTRSLMPDGFEKDLSQQDLADLVKFLGSP